MLYSRFICHAFNRAGILNFREPFLRYFSQGILYKDGAKMSKSRGNVVSIDHFLDRYGADTGRMISIFWGPPDRDVEWQEGGVGGCFRFLKRLFTFFDETWEKVRDAGAADTGDASPEAKALLSALHAGIRDVTASMDAWSFNIVVSSLMILFNQLSEHWDALPKASKADANMRALMKSALKTIPILLSPIAPHLAEELWEKSGGEGFVMHASWPSHDERFLQVSEVEYGISVNGKLRGRITVPVETCDAEIEKLALAEERVVPHVKGKKVLKVLVIRDRLVNIVVK